MGNNEKESEALTIKPGNLVGPLKCDAVKQELLRNSVVGEGKIIFDLRETEEIDSYGLALLIATRNSFTTGRGRQVELFSPSARVMEILKWFNLEQQFYCTGSR